MTPLIYIAHPVGVEPARAANLLNVGKWVRWLVEYVPEAAFSLPWYAYVAHIGEEHRERGLRDDLEGLSRCDAVLAVGGRCSPGMRDELDTADALELPTADLLFCGREPPVCGTRDHALALEIVRELLQDAMTSE